MSSEPIVCQRIETVHQMKVSVHFVRWKFLNMPKTSQRIEQTSRDIPYKERIHRIRNGYKTDMNGHERIKLFFILCSSVSLV